MSTFTWSPAPDCSQEVSPRVSVSQFGDGYQQRVAQGINNKPRKWSLQFSRETADINAIEAFLVAAGGVLSFNWTPPNGASGKFICKQWTRTTNAVRAQTISATFEEVFGE